jgi:hypothetical protein
MRPQRSRSAKPRSDDLAYADKPQEKSQRLTAASLTDRKVPTPSPVCSAQAWGEGNDGEASAVRGIVLHIYPLAAIMPRPTGQT